MDPIRSMMFKPNPFLFSLFLMINTKHCWLSYSSLLLLHATLIVNALTSGFFVIPDMAGIVSCSASTSVNSLSWLIDRGATDHVICSLTLFASYKSVTNLFIYLPNGQNVPVAYISTVQLTPFLSLYNALYVPTFSFNLIYASTWPVNLTVISSVNLLFGSSRT